MNDVKKELDTSGLNCPMPVLRAKKALEKLNTGDVLRVIATDPGSSKDFNDFAKQTGHELLESREEGLIFIFQLKKN